MVKIGNVRKLLLHRVTVATGAGLLAVVAGFGMAPAGAADGAEAGVEAEVEADRLGLFFTAIEDLEADINTKGDKLSAEGSGETESHVGDQSFTVQVTMGVSRNGVEFKVNDIKALISL